MKKIGYTIAETLITMTIIGVVASLIMPTFIAKYRKNVYASRLSSAVANFDNAMTTLIMKEGVDNLFDTVAWQSIKQTNGSYLLKNDSSDDNILAFMNGVGKIMQIDNYTTDEASYKTLAAPNGDATALSEPVRFQLRNGTEYLIQISDLDKSKALKEIDILSSGGNLDNVAAVVYIDVNGQSSPNIIGRDLFKYELGVDGRLYPYGGKDWAIYHKETYNSPETKCKTNKDGDYCAAYLMDNNYKMDY